MKSESAVSFVTAPPEGFRQVLLVGIKGKGPMKTYFLIGKKAAIL